MMERQTIKDIKWVSKKFGYEPSRQHIHALTDHGLQALDKIEELQDEIKDLNEEISQLREAYYGHP